MPKQVERRSGKSNNEIYEKLIEIEKQLALREHFDEMIQTDHDLIGGNGKSGFKTIRDKVEKWDITINALIVLIIGDVIVRAVGFFAN
jgi:hypothetical protein